MEKQPDTDVDISHVNAIICMVGLPACGKSSLSVILSDQLLVYNYNVKIVELD
jgi:adenylylsulfate kinase-like enzyme